MMKLTVITHMQGDRDSEDGDTDGRPDVVDSDVSSEMATLFALLELQFADDACGN
jgi:hypothetical protein